MLYSHVFRSRRWMTRVAGGGHARIWGMCFVLGPTSLCHKRHVCNWCATLVSVQPFRDSSCRNAPPYSGHASKQKQKTHRFRSSSVVDCLYAIQLICGAWTASHWQYLFLFFHKKCLQYFLGGNIDDPQIRPRWNFRSIDPATNTPTTVLFLLLLLLLHKRETCLKIILSLSQFTSLAHIPRSLIWST